MRAEPSARSQHPVNFSDRKSCESRDKNSSRDQRFMWLSVHESFASEDLKYFICHVTSKDHLIEGLYEFTGWSSSQYVTTQTNLMTVNIVIVETCFYFVTWLHVTTFVKDYVNLWEEAPNGKSPCHVWSHLV